MHVVTTGCWPPPSTLPARERSAGDSDSPLPGSASELCWVPSSPLSALLCSPHSLPSTGCRSRARLPGRSLDVAGGGTHGRRGRLATVLEDDRVAGQDTVELAA